MYGDVFLLVLHEDAILPDLQEDLLVLSLHLATTMLLILVPLARVDRAILTGECAFAILHVILPHALVSVLLASEQLTLSMALACLPLAHVEVLIVVVALAVAFSEVFPPLPMVLIVSPLVLVRTIVHSLTISFVVQYLTLIDVTIEVWDLRELPYIVHLQVVKHVSILHLAYGGISRAIRSVKVR